MDTTLKKSPLLHASLKIALTLLLTLSLTLSFLQAQNVTVSGALAGNGTYPTLTAAFTAINSGSQSGANIQVAILNNTNEGTTSAVLIESTGPWATLTIQPVGGQWTVSGNVSSNPLLDLNGADNVTIDGIAQQGLSLTFSNASTSSSAGTSTLRFVNSATNNTITRCNIQGAADAVPTTPGGTVFFSTASPPGGNNNNTLSFCDIGPVGSNLPGKAVFALGSNSPAFYNTGNQILDCKIHDYFRALSDSYGIYSGDGNTAWTISNNRFYQTYVRVQSGDGGLYAGIYLNGSAGNEGCSITGNTIGYATATATGITHIVGSSITFSRFAGILVAAASANSPNLIQGNTIANITLGGTFSSTTPVAASFSGISVQAGNATISGNLIGSTTTPNSITIDPPTNNVYHAVGISGTGPTLTYSNNQVGGFNCQAVAFGACTVYGIYSKASNYTMCTIQGNVIGYAAAPMTSTSTANTSRMIGIAAIDVPATIIGNQVGYFDSPLANSNTHVNSGMVGILYDGMSAQGNNILSGNTVRALRNAALNAGINSTVAGILYRGNVTGSHVIEGNQVHSLLCATPSSLVYGIYLVQGAAMVKNNMVRLGLDDGGYSIYGPYSFVGIKEAYGWYTIYHNSVYIGGSGVGGGAIETAAFYTQMNAGPRDYRDNIFVNNRSNGSGAGIHTALRLGLSGLDLTDLVSNYNDLRATGNGGRMASLNGTGYTNLPAWQVATNRDLQSLNVDPLFVNPTGNATTVDLHLQPVTPMDAAGIALTSVPLDIDSEARNPLTPDIGADENPDSCTPAITITANPGSPLCPGTSITFTATTTYGGTSPTYQWLLNGGNVGTNSPTYNSAALGIGNTITCQLTSNAICAIPATATSNTLVVMDSILPTITCPIDLNAPYCAPVVNYINPLIADNCGNLSLVQTAGLASGSTFPMGTTTNTFQVTDAAGNIATCSFTVTVSMNVPAMNCAVTIDTFSCGHGVSCRGAFDGVAHAVGNGGCPGYTYEWSTGATTDSANVLSAGTYTVTVTDANGSTQVLSVTLTEPVALTLWANSLTPSCAGDSTGAVDILPSGGNDCLPYTYIWSNGATTEDLVNVPPGLYHCTVTDVSGCTTTFGFNVPTNPAPVPSITQFGNTLTSVQAWYSYQWLLNGVPIPGATTQWITAVASGNYTLIVTDANGCEGTSAIFSFVFVGLSQPVGPMDDIVLYPNPAMDFLYLRTSYLYTAVSMYNALGQRLDIAIDGDRVDIAALPEGTYFVVVQTDDGRNISRVFVKSP